MYHLLVIWHLCYVPRFFLPVFSTMAMLGKPDDVGKNYEALATSIMIAVN